MCLLFNPLIVNVMNIASQKARVLVASGNKLLSIMFDNGKVTSNNDTRNKLLYAAGNRRAFDMLATGYALLLSRYETPSILPEQDNGLYPYADALKQMGIIVLDHVGDANGWTHCKGLEYYKLAPDFLEAIKTI